MVLSQRKAILAWLTLDTGVISKGIPSIPGHLSKVWEADWETLHVHVQRGLETTLHDCQPASWGSIMAD